jgi:pimeloyl-ACP methyl ester carboxylesterase
MHRTENSHPKGIVRAAGLALALLLVGDGGSVAAEAARTAQIEGRTVAYSVQGAGKPTLVLISGLGSGMSTFNGVAPEFAKGATVIAYDRAGYGGSARPEGARDAASVDRELMSLLTASGVPGPYILVGHSNGGLYAEYFASKHPDLVAGLIFDDSRPADFGRRCEAARLGPCTPTPAMVRNSSPGEQAEVAGLPAAFAQVEAITPVSGKPVLVLSRPTSASKKPIDRLWGQTQDDLAARYPGSTHLTAPGGGHNIHNDRKDWFITSVRDWIQRTGAGAGR